MYVVDVVCVECVEIGIGNCWIDYCDVVVGVV